MLNFRSRKVLLAIAIVMLTLSVGTAGLFLLSITSRRPGNLGVRDGQLASCPDSPNCVSTQAQDREHWIAPISFEQNPDTVIDSLEEIINQMPNSRVIEKSPHYLYAEFRSSFFRFVDDVEFSVERESRRIHFRSASRVGHSDLGVNRNRMEAIRNLYQASRSTSVRKISEQAAEIQKTPLASGSL